MLDTNSTSPQSKDLDLLLFSGVSISSRGNDFQRSVLVNSDMLSGRDQSLALEGNNVEGSTEFQRLHSHGLFEEDDSPRVFVSANVNAGSGDSSLVSAATEVGGLNASESTDNASEVPPAIGRQHAALFSNPQPASSSAKPGASSKQTSKPQAEV